MSENIFYGFEDVSDDYDYGTEVYKDDIYEFHPNMQIPYKERSLFYIPNGLFEEKCQDIGGYLRLGRESSCKLKFNIQVTIHDEEEEKPQKSNTINKGKKKTAAGNTKDARNNTGTVQTQISLTAQGNNKNATSPEIAYDLNRKNKIVEKPGEIKIISDDKLTEEYLKEKLESIDVFNSTYVDKLKKVYYNKERKKRENKDNLIFPLNALRVRVYIFRCLNLSAQENCNSVVDNLAGYSAFCKANSFIEIKVGEGNNTGNEKSTKYINDVASLVENTLNPSFFKFYELEADLPQDWRLEINIKSKGTGESLIGSTVIDLENRYLGDVRCRELLQCKSLEEEYMKMFNEDMEEDKRKELNKRLSIIQLRLKEIEDTKIPVEFRPLFKPNANTAQGVIEMLVEILPMKIAKIKRPLKIEPPPAQEYELRLVLWETRNVFVPGKVIFS